MFFYFSIGFFFLSRQNQVHIHDAHCSNMSKKCITNEFFSSKSRWNLHFSFSFIYAVLEFHNLSYCSTSSNGWASTNITVILKSSKLYVYFCSVYLYILIIYSYLVHKKTRKQNLSRSSCCVLHLFEMHSFLFECAMKKNRFFFSFSVEVYVFLVHSSISIGSTSCFYTEHAL